jgi:uncharacterized protein
MLVDSHVHLSRDDSGGEELLKVMDRLGFDKAVVFGGAEYWGFAGDEMVMEAYRMHPDRFIPLGWFRMGVHSPDIIDRKAEQGFMGLKTSASRANYDDPSYFPFYQKIVDHNLPVLFHLGILMRMPQDPEEDINNNRLRPIYLDTIARRFPRIKIIGAHFGNPWYDEAGMVARWNGNLWFDLSGSTLKKLSSRRIRELLWWDKPGNYYQGHLGKHPFEKIVFGTDVGYERMGDVYNDYLQLCDELEMDEGFRKKLFGETVLEIFDPNNVPQLSGDEVNPFKKTS